MLKCRTIMIRLLFLICFLKIKRALTFQNEIRPTVEKRESFYPISDHSGAISDDHSLTTSLLQIESQMRQVQAIYTSNYEKRRPTEMAKNPKFGERVDSFKGNGRPFASIPIGVRMHFTKLSSDKPLRFRVRHPITQRAPLNYLFEVDFECDYETPLGVGRLHVNTSFTPNDSWVYTNSTAVNATFGFGDGNGGTSKVYWNNTQKNREYLTSEDGSGLSERHLKSKVGGRCPGATLRLRLHCGSETNPNLAGEPSECALPLQSVEPKNPSARRTIISTLGDRLEYWEETRYTRENGLPSLECGCSYGESSWANRYMTMSAWYGELSIPSTKNKQKVESDVALKVTVFDICSGRGKWTKDGCDCDYGYTGTYLEPQPRWQGYRAWRGETLGCSQVTHPTGHVVNASMHYNVLNDTISCYTSLASMTRSEMSEKQQTACTGRPDRLMAYNGTAGELYDGREAGRKWQLRTNHLDIMKKQHNENVSPIKVRQYGLENLLASSHLLHKEKVIELGILHIWKTQCKNIYVNFKEKIEWSDASGDNCAEYAIDDWCENNGKSYMKYGITATEACCVCGGGGLPASGMCGDNFDERENKKIGKLCIPPLVLRNDAMYVSRGESREENIQNCCRAPSSLAANYDTIGKGIESSTSQMFGNSSTDAASTKIHLKDTAKMFNTTNSSSSGTSKLNRFADKNADGTISYSAFPRRDDIKQMRNRDDARNKAYMFVYSPLLLSTNGNKNALRGDHTSSTSSILKSEAGDVNYYSNMQKKRIEQSLDELAKQNLELETYIKNNKKLSKN